MENPQFFEKKILFERESIIHVKRWVTAERSHATGEAAICRNWKSGNDWHGVGGQLKEWRRLSGWRWWLFWEESKKMWTFLVSKKIFYGEMCLGRVKRTYLRWEGWNSPKKLIFFSLINLFKIKLVVFSNVEI